jgi:hypothetical protein
MPPFPKVLAYVWRAYFRMRRRMAGGFAGPNPIGWQDIDAFVRQSGLRLAPWELNLIEAIDDLYLEALSGTKRSPPAPKEKGLIATAPMHDPQAVKSLLGSIGRRRVVKKKGERPHG